jgi:hypothetical protein
MAKVHLPWIVNPSLGCPIIASVGQINHGTRLILADDHYSYNWDDYSLDAVPCAEGNGERFSLLLDDPRPITEDTLPEVFQDVGESLQLLSTLLRTEIFGPDVGFWSFRVRPPGGKPLDDRHYRKSGDRPVTTLYNLELRHKDKATRRVKHALGLRPPAAEVRFIHLTDLHVAARNDIWEREINATVNPKLGAEEPLFINFNRRFRQFIKKANALADTGKLDFVLMLGDLVDFVNQGYASSQSQETNWQVFLDMVTGDDGRGEGLRVPIFTTTGNHDWRTNPYPPERNPDVFGLSSEELKKLEFLYSDPPATTARVITETHDKLIATGSPILTRTWWGTLVGWGMRVDVTRWGNWAVAFLSRYLGETATSLFLAGAGATGYGLRNGLRWPTMPELLLLACLFVPKLGLRWIQSWIGAGLRTVITSLLSIQSDVRGLQEYFLRINPYFNYAFRVENCYFLILDTGHDMLTAESFWDEGAKKARHLKIRDNIIGGSPESMAFLQPNQYYPYSQNTYLERLLECIRREQGQLAGRARTCRIFVGLHAPPANVSPEDREELDAQVQNDHGTPVPVSREFDLHYGGINHYLSQFYYLCLGYRESNTQQVSGPGIDVVLAGHAHWNLEFRIARPEGPRMQPTWEPQAFYGPISEAVEGQKIAQAPGDDSEWTSLLLQTAACGPPSKLFRDTPYLRYITVDKALEISTLRSLPLWAVPDRVTGWKCNLNRGAGE